MAEYNGKPARKRGHSPDNNRQPSRYQPNDRQISLEKGSIRYPRERGSRDDRRGEELRARETRREEYPASPARGSYKDDKYERNQQQSRNYEYEQRGRSRDLSPRGGQQVDQRSYSHERRTPDRYDRNQQNESIRDVSSRESRAHTNTTSAVRQRSPDSKRRVENTQNACAQKASIGPGRKSPSRGGKTSIQAPKNEARGGQGSGKTAKTAPRAPAPNNNEQKHSASERDRMPSPIPVDKQPISKPNGAERGPGTQDSDVHIVKSNFRRPPKCNWTDAEHNGILLSKIHFFTTDPDLSSSRFVPRRNLEIGDCRLEIIRAVNGTYQCMAFDKAGNRCGWVQTDQLERIKGLDASGHSIRCALQYNDAPEKVGAGELWEGVFSFQAYGCPKDQPPRQASKPHGQKQEKVGFDGMVIKSEKI